MELRIARTTASFELLEFTTDAFIVRFGGFFTTVCSTGFSTFDRTNSISHEDMLKKFEISPR